jgi:hypothetical protein
MCGPSFLAGREMLSAGTGRYPVSPYGKSSSTMQRSFAPHMPTGVDVAGEGILSPNDLPAAVAGTLDRLAAIRGEVPLLSWNPGAL